MGRRFQHGLTAALFDHLAVAHEDNMVCDTATLGKIMGDKQDRIVFLQFKEQFLDCPARHGVNRGGGLIEEQDFRFYSEGSGNAEPLLLSA